MSMFRRGMEDIKIHNEFVEMKIYVCDILDRIKSRLGTPIKKISEFKDIAMKIIQKETQRKSLKINEQNISELRDNSK